MALLLNDILKGWVMHYILLAEIVNIRKNLSHVMGDFQHITMQHFFPCLKWSVVGLITVPYSKLIQEVTLARITGKKEPGS